MSLAQRPFPTASDGSEQPDQTAALAEAWPEELETPVRDLIIMNDDLHGRRKRLPGHGSHRVQRRAPWRPGGGADQRHRASADGPARGRGGAAELDRGGGPSPDPAAEPP